MPPPPELSTFQVSQSRRTDRGTTVLRADQFASRFPERRPHPSNPRQAQPPPIPCLFQRFAALFLRPARQLIFPEYNDILFMRMTGFLVLLVDLMASSSHPTSSGAGLNYEDSPSLGSLRLCWTAFEHPEVILSGHIVGIH